MNVNCGEKVEFFSNLSLSDTAAYIRCHNITLVPSVTNI